MAKLLLPIFLILTVCAVAAAQDSKAQNCPSIKITEPDQRDIFLATAELSVEISGNPQPTGFEWQISRGIITSGSDSRTVNVSFSREDDSQIAEAEVRVKGLPPGCHNRATIRFEVVINPGSPLILDEFGDQDISDIKARLQAAASELEKHPDSHLFFVVRNETPGKNPFADFLASLEGYLTGELALNRDQFKIVKVKGSQPYVTIYLHPNDAEPIFVMKDIADPLQCPTISVTGPAGIVGPNETAKYYVDISGTSSLDLTYSWNVTHGTIVNGQGAKSIAVRLTDDFWGEQLATVEIGGLPTGCPNTASEKYEISIDYGPERLGELTSLSPGKFEGTLDGWTKVLADHPTNQMYVIFEHRREAAEKEVLEQEAAFVEHLVNGPFRIEPSRLTLRRRGSEKQLVHVWRVRPGVENPNCDRCEPIVSRACPEIAVTGPAGIVLPGDSADFRAEILPRGSEPLTMVWTVSAGVIEKGQGESTLTVRTDKTMDGHLLTAYLQITGLPTGCPNTAVGEGIVASLTDPVLIDEYGQLPENDEFARLDQTVYEVSKKADWVAVFVISAAPEEMQDSVRDRVKRIEDHLFGLRRMDREKVRFTYRHGTSSATAIYRISADSMQDFVESYGESETLEGLFSKRCPTIMVTGPAGITAPGEVITFAASYDGPRSERIRFTWTVIGGTIVAGQGTLNLKVRPPDGSHSRLVTFEVEGLDQQCPNSASEFADFIVEPDVIFLDEFSSSVTDIRKDVLRSAVREHQRSPTHQLYIIEYFPSGTSEFSIREKLERIKRFMADQLDFDISALTIVTAQADQPWTKVYRIPPGTDRPVP